MPIYCVPPIYLDSSRKILDCLLEIEEPIPHQPTAIKRRCVSRIQGEDLVEGVEGLGEALSTHLLTNGAQMV